MPLKVVLLRDARKSKWDGEYATVLDVEGHDTLERSVSKGEIAVFQATGEIVEANQGELLRNGKTRTKKVKAHVYERVRTRLVG
jgi:hypothetical protein